MWRVDGTGGMSGVRRGLRKMRDVESGNKEQTGKVFKYLYLSNIKELRE